MVILDKKILSSPGQILDFSRDFSIYRDSFEKTPDGFSVVIARDIQDFYKELRTTMLAPDTDYLNSYVLSNSGHLESCLDLILDHKTVINLVSIPLEDLSAKELIRNIFHTEPDLNYVEKDTETLIYLNEPVKITYSVGQWISSIIPAGERIYFSSQPGHSLWHTGIITINGLPYELLRTRVKKKEILKYYVL
jgi:hypothetical protein